MTTKSYTGTSFPGIDNSSEFYTHHYLAAVLSRDLSSKVYSEWGDDEADEKKPHEKLRALSQDFFKLRAELEAASDPQERYELHQAFLAAFLYALGYDPTARRRPLPVSELTDELETVAEIRRADGAPVLWALQVTAPSPDASEEDPLNLHLLDTAVEELISKHVFNLDEPPRFLLVCGESQVLLVDRTKWREKRLLRFDLEEILGRKDTETLKVTAALLSQSQIWHDGHSLLDALDESSHQHAFSVSEDLKYALREAIELLGNEAIHYLRTIKKEKIYGRDLEEQLSRECLRFMYRVLFLFYIEARPELGYAPMGNDAYRLGYSLESLRELELVELTTEESLNGYFLHESLKLLFGMIHDGVTADDQAELFRGDGSSPAEPVHGLFELSPLRTHLFDSAGTPILSGVKLRNQTVQQIIELMSLSRADGRKSRGRRDRRGRISYAQLGINQLGAVYEALLSYRGFFAEVDLYEVKRKKDDYDPLETAYFVAKEELPKYDDKEIVKDEKGALVCHPQGSFIYRLAGRDREKSASYYTPEVLTRCLVKYSLKELLSEAKAADEILHLTVCEPAMGSAAFLNEAVNQLAEAYLQKKQDETGQEIPHDEYLLEKQRVKMFIADRNVFGVDLNPIAVELAEVSLWLNTIHAGGFVPWFGAQLRCGNSLIGARRQVYTREQLDSGPKGKTARWLKEAPRELREPRELEHVSDGSVYHFFLGHPDMADYDDYIIRGQGGKNPLTGLAEDAHAHFKKWRGEFCGALDEHEVESLVELSRAVDRLWARHVESLASIRHRTTDPLDVWPHQVDDDHSPSTTAEKDRILEQELYSRATRASSPYRRLKLVMDYWCALWFWPNDEYEEIPDRDEYLWDLSLILDAPVFQGPQPAQGDLTNLFPETRPEEESRRLAEELGFVDIDALIARGDDMARRLSIVKELAERHRFHHWELEFADLFEARGGFDLILGNPPWIRLAWNEVAVLGDSDPFFVIKNLSAVETRKRRETTIEDLNLRARFLSEYENIVGTQNFLSSAKNYGELRGMKVNLYKCFIPTGWRIGNDDSVVGLLHPEGIYDDVNGGAFREMVYPRLRYHFQFHNERGLFAEVHHATMFSINIYAHPTTANLRFANIANLFLPRTVSESLEHHGQGPVPGIKDDDNNWNIRGHASRVIHVTPDELALFARLYDDEGTPPLQARLPALHSTQLVQVLQKFAVQSTSLADLTDEYLSSNGFDETKEQKVGTIRRDTRFPTDPSEWILSGPHFFVANPFNKTPREVCNHNQAYDPIDLTDLPDDYLPRTNYVPDCSPEEYLRRTPRVPWGVEKPVTEFYRLVSRTMIGSSSERTLQSAIVQKNIGHLDLGFSLTFNTTALLTLLSGFFVSTPFDFFVKSTGKSHFRNDIAQQLPIPEISSAMNTAIQFRSLLLNCLTTHYADLWNECFDPAFTSDRWAKEDPHLDNAHFQRLTGEWTRDVALRTDFARRQALVEIDVLAAMALGLTLEELQTIYRVQFPVMRMYEDDTWYDQKGRIVFTNSRGLVGVGLPRKKSSSYPEGPYWEDIQDMEEGTVTQTVLDDTLPGGPREKTITYHAPFTRCDREADYAAVWTEFARRFAVGATRIPETTDAAKTRRVLHFPIPEDVYASFETPLAARDAYLDEEAEVEIFGAEDPELFDNIPYASNISRLHGLLEAAAYDGDFGSFSEFTGRTWYRYIALARWLELIDDLDGVFYLSRHGAEFLNGENYYRVVRDQVHEAPLIQAILRDERWPGDAETVIQGVLRERSRLSGKSIKRRTQDVYKLLDMCGLAEQTDIFLPVPEARERSEKEEGLQPEDAEPQDAVSDEPEIPQANSVELLTGFLEALLTYNAIDDLADHLKVAPRTINYYAALARWLEFATPVLRGEWELTESGRLFATSPATREHLYPAAITSHEICRQIFSRTAAGEDLHEVTLDEVQARTTLAPATAQRRAHALTKLLEVARDPALLPGVEAHVASPVTEEAETVGAEEPTPSPAASDEQTPGADDGLAADGQELRVPVGTLDPPGIIAGKLADAGVETVEDLLALSTAEFRSLSGVGYKKVRALEELKERAAKVTTFVPDEDPLVMHLPDMPWRDIAGDIPSRIVSAAEQEGIETLADLRRAVASGEIRKWKGVGARSVRELEVLLHRISEEGVESPALAAVEDTPLKVLEPILPTRVSNAAEKVGVKTLGELVEWRRKGGLAKQSGVGTKSVREVGELLVEIADRGLNPVLYGVEFVPERVPEFIDMVYDACDERVARILRGRFEEGLILQDLGDELGITRERIRQIESGALARSQQQFGRLARRLLEPTVRALEESSGLLWLEDALERSGARSGGRLVLGLHVAGYESARRWERFLTIRDADGVSLLLNELKEELVELDLLRVDLEQAQECATRVGLQMERSGLQTLLDDGYGITVDGDAFTVPWLNLRDVIAGAVARIGRAAKTDEVQAAYDALREAAPERLPKMASRNIRSHLDNSEEIYGYGHGVYIHVDNLPMSETDLARAVDWALNYLDGRTEQISAEFLLREMEYDRVAPPGMTPHLLKSALNRCARVLSFFNTLLVANAESYVDSGMTMLDRINEALRKHEEPVSSRQIGRDLSRFSYSKFSLNQALLEQPFAMPMGGNRFLHVDRSGLTEAERGELLAELEILLPEDGTPLGANAALNVLESQGAQILRAHPQGGRILWSLARGYTELVAAGGELIAKRTDESSRSLFRAAILDAIAELGVARPRDVRAWMREQVGYDDRGSAIGTAMNNLYQDGTLHRLPNAVYFHATDRRGDLIEAFAERPALVREGALQLAADDELPREVLTALIEFFGDYDPDPELVETLRGSGMLEGTDATVLEEGVE